MAKSYMLSTEDNPYNPWTQWDAWLAWDTQEGYYSLALLGRTIRTSDEFPEEVQEADGQDAIDTIVTENLSGVHIKVASPLDD